MATHGTELRSTALVWPAGAVDKLAVRTVVTAAAGVEIGYTGLVFSDTDKYPVNTGRSAGVAPVTGLARRLETLVFALAYAVDTQPGSLVSTATPEIHWA